MKYAAISGGAGDCVYSIPIMRALNVSRYYIKENFYHSPHGNLFQTMRSFMQSQGFECMPTTGAVEWGSFDPALKYDYNIDNFRHQPNRGRNHIMVSMANQFRVKFPGFSPWLNIPGEQKDFSLIHLTPRWRERSNVNWHKVLRSIKGPVYFIGFQYEWLDFQLKYGDIEWKATEDIYEMACLVKQSKALYCNQSVALTLAQGMGKTVYLERKPGKTNVLTRQKNEIIL